ncbi:MAG TPA: phosphopantothenoylcysteine decarboxylase [Bacteroidales bacterium]|nr:phosphopantothenoylcysteine decarboxylase [Bacteroidales bacterium]
MRFISNYSSGKMGIAIAETAALYGADVELVLGPVDIKPDDDSIIVTNVTNAAEMAEACVAKFPGCDIAILSAAVADFTPVASSEMKIKKNSHGMTLQLKSTMDIAATLGKMRRDDQFIAGFALETTKGLDEAVDKLKRKNMNMIVLNSLQEEGAGFGYDTNRVTIIDKNNNIDKFELKSKAEVARDILDKIISMQADLSE